MYVVFIALSSLRLIDIFILEHDGSKIYFRINLVVNTLCIYVDTSRVIKTYSIQ